jgi:hypothetical protein
MRGPGCRERRRKVGLAFMLEGEGNRLASPAVNYFDHDRKELSSQETIRLPLFTSCLEVKFSETRMQPLVSLFVRTGAMGGFESDKHRAQPQDVVVLGKDASRVTA